MSSSKNMKVNLEIWRQNGPQAPGKFATSTARGPLSLRAAAFHT